MHRFKARKWWFYGSAVLLVLLVAFGVVVARKGNGAYETFVVLSRDVVENVRVSGTVEASIISDLGFEASGVVRDVTIAVNDTVGRGQTLASLRLGTLTAESQSAQAAVALKQAQTSNTGINLDVITEKQDTLVQNARIELYSADLVAEPHSTTYTQTPPVINGRYTGGAGTYKLVIRNAAQKTETELNVFGMEETEPVEVSKTGPTSLGENGLFVTFPDGPAAYEGTTWYVAIPNTKSSSYAANFSAYQEAGRERERALEEARADLREQS
ncbi:MAG TPA: efflux RND transporter periplasmic adaptor subunit, partial [Candidatus Paceibacterota bacterium]|nr:efflux RND transporter periplasmic adaptor subunit [Candidatus Paceibacterota bacterium]